MREPRNCEHCGASFTPRREHARFCSPRCRVAWNRQHTRDRPAEATALGWSLDAMCDTTARLRQARAASRQHALATISEAVWWVTLVDATLVRYHPDTYDRTLAAQPPAQRQVTEETLAGLRFVRNRMGHHLDPADFVHPAPRRPGPLRIGHWTWAPLPEPALSTLPEHGQEWELSRYQAYQAQLAGHPVGDTFTRAAEFLRQTATQATSGAAMSTASQL
jgi:hypothetical protein